MNLSRRFRLVDTLLLTLLAVILVAPVFRVKYLDNWPSIESTFISDARMLAEHMPHPGWQPLWYCGTRFDYIYPPALRYGTAVIALAGRVSTAKAYHIYIGLLYAFGLVSVYWLVLIGSGSRFSAWLSTFAVALLSPSLFLFRLLGDDSPWMVPQRLHALMSYGEGPHISALAVLPAALAASFAALRERRMDALGLAGALCAFTVANNFYGATSLAMFFPIVAWSVWVGTRDNSVWLRALGIVALAYGFSAFWLTPSYFRITWINMRWVSNPGNTPSRLIMLCAIAIFCAASWRCTNRRRDRIWPTFVAGAAVVYSIYVIGFFYAELRILGEPGRLVPELDLALLLLAVLIVSAVWTWRKSGIGQRAAATVLGIILFLPSTIYLQHAHTPFPRAANWENQYERRITGWVAANLHGERVMPSGTIRYWYDAWFDNAEPVGGSDQGMLNQLLPIISYQIYQNEDPDIVTLWLQALGTSAVIVPDDTSYEHYHDYPKPEKFRGHLPVLFDDQHGTVIYRVPRVHPGLGRLVDRAKATTLGELVDGDDLDRLKRYLAMVEGPQPETQVVWSGFDALQMKATVGEGQSVLLQETYDAAWHAYAGGKPLPIHRDPVMGFMLIDAAPGAQTIDVRFETPLENRVGQALFVLSLLVAGRLRTSDVAADVGSRER